MSTHTWEIEEIDGGVAGKGDFYICKACGASGGPVWGAKDTPPSMAPFLSGTGIKLGFDCEVAASKVTKYKAQQVKAAEILKAYTNGKMTRMEAALRIAAECHSSILFDLPCEKKLLKRVGQIREAMLGGLTLTVGTCEEWDEDENF